MDERTACGWEPAGGGGVGVGVGWGCICSCCRCSVRTCSAWLQEARAFYGGILECAEGRSAKTWVDFSLYGHQVDSANTPPRPGALHELCRE